MSFETRNKREGRAIAILGSTGSIGCSTLELLAWTPDAFRVVALAAGRRFEKLAEQVWAHRPRLAAIADPGLEPQLRALCEGSGCEIRSGPEGLAAVATEAGADLVVAAIVGAAGLEPTYRAVEAGVPVALANKEALVMAGALMIGAARRHGSALLPVDSEHNALHQCLRGESAREVRRLILTASGGPFRSTPPGEMGGITPAQALKHPTWEMGPKITIDSATLMNKGLEVIEAHHLFGLPAGKIDVLIHPQSVVHSMVEFVDGSIVAQLGVNDMKHPIQYALTYPERRPTPLPPLDLVARSPLQFEPVDPERFPCLGLAYAALRSGTGAPVALNAANEIAVAAFLEGRLPFLGIAEVADAVMAKDFGEPGTLMEVLDVDRRARVAAARRVEGRVVA